jgi:hypothetical protein
MPVKNCDVRQLDPLRTLNYLHHLASESPLSERLHISPPVHLHGFPFPVTIPPKPSNVLRGISHPGLT